MEAIIGILINKKSLIAGLPDNVHVKTQYQKLQ
jgi:hypothetical protein